MFVLQQEQNLGRKNGASKLHFIPPVALAAVRSKSVVLLLLIRSLLLWDSVIVLCFVLRYFVSILFLQSTRWGKRMLVALLCLSSWCLVILVWLFLTTPRVCLQFVIVVFPDYYPLLFLIYSYLVHALYRVIDCLDYEQILLKEFT